MNESITQLDADELFHFALKASQNKEHKKAVLYLKQAIEQAPDNSRSYFLLGAQYADLGMFEKAIECMKKAVDLNPELHAANFQLGLLYATSARIEQAETAWTPLNKLSQEHPLYLFKTGLLQLSRDKFTDARSNLQKGIQLNSIDPALNKDMQNLLNQIDQIILERPAEETEKLPEESVTATTGSKHVYLSAYTNKNDEEDSD